MFFLAFALVLVVPQASFAEEGVEGELPEDEENIELGESIRLKVNCLIHRWKRWQHIEVLLLFLVPKNK